MARRVVFVAVAVGAVSVVSANLLMPTGRTIEVLPVAAIDESNDTVGISDSNLYFDTPDQVDAALDQMQALGVDTVRVILPWALVNPLSGYYDWTQPDYLINAADARGMGVLAVVATTPAWAQDPGSAGLVNPPTSAADFGAFAGLAAQRYAGKVGAYEIWNEPNAAMFYAPQPDPAGYSALLKAAYPTIKAADPDAIVVGGVVGSTVTMGDWTLNPVTFVDEMYRDGAQGYFDALSFHPYQYTTPFSQGGDLANSPINQLTDIRNLMVANGDTEKSVWSTEYGEPTAVAGEAQQATYLEDMLTSWRSLDYTGPAFVYTLQDTDSGSTDPEATFGLIRSDGTWKPAAYVVRDLATSAGATPEKTRVAARGVRVEERSADRVLRPNREARAAAADSASPRTAPKHRRGDRDRAGEPSARRDSTGEHRQHRHTRDR
jgi:hypothetical protein